MAEDLSFHTENLNLLCALNVGASDGCLKTMGWKAKLKMCCL